MPILYFLFALAIGLVMPLQAAINSQLQNQLGGSTLLAALVSFVVGSVALAAALLLSGQRWPERAQWLQADGWMYAGGAMGALIVFGTTLLAPRIGVAAMMLLLIAGQVLVSLLFDRYGWLGMPVREIGVARLLGAALVVGGVVLVNFGDKLGR
ncbi:hypothetical protein IGB42_03307 [Andreprevotia sp. IGB-42]|uniref:DMT family transporter n=1 Tax=Andreprevotia sp. IGB-42 TaxID=2497473 RepID=UPI001358298B|nr:DMT family transporter [Andreprevotia sp. IGB-42]KAF0812317.1 hypothetical protein IGB42_03307 [Andreprevotia sp. IGB-42]